MSIKKTLGWLLALGLLYLIARGGAASIKEFLLWLLIMGLLYVPVYLFIVWLVFRGGKGRQAAEQEAFAEAFRQVSGASAPNVDRSSKHLHRLGYLYGGLPTGTLEGLSRMGGVPSLPRDVGWPVAPSTDAPLHFVAQVDLASCSGLKEAEGRVQYALPPSGMLYFFADISIDGVDTCGVIYAAAPGPDRVPPPGLPKIGHSHGADGDHFAIDCQVYGAVPLQYSAVGDSIGFSGGEQKLQLLGTPSIDFDEGEQDDILLMEVWSNDFVDQASKPAGLIANFSIQFWIKEADLQAARFERTWVLSHGED